MTREQAYAMLPPNAWRSSSFGHKGEPGFAEYWRTPEGERFEITNGRWPDSGREWWCREVVP